MTHDKSMTSVSIHLSENSSANAIIKCIDIFLEELFSTIKLSSENFRDEIQFYYHLRKENTALILCLKKVTDNFDTLKSNQKSNLNEKLHEAVIRLEYMKETVKSDIRKDHSFLIAPLVINEFDRTLRQFSKSKRIMTNKLSINKINHLKNNPELRNRLQEAWGDLAFED